MAGDWLKVELTTPDKPEVFALAERLGIDPDAAFGKLFRMWRWFDQHTEEGNINNVTFALLDRIVGVTGFAECVADLGWLEATDNGLALPNFSAHNGKTAKSRAETARRVAKHKLKKTSDDTPESDGRCPIPMPIRRAVLERDNATCVYCGRPDGKSYPTESPRDATMHVDHVVPVSRGGANDLSNLVCACGACNLYKSDRTPDECGLKWPVTPEGKRFGNTISVTAALPREEKKREDIKEVVVDTREEPKSEPVETAPSNTQAQVVVNEWNLLGEPFPACMKLTDKRRTALRQRLSDPEWSRTWRQALDRLKAARFARGENKSGWVADIDFFLRPDSVVKILEGKYDNGENRQQQRTFEHRESDRRFNSGQVYDPNADTSGIIV